MKIKFYTYPIAVIAFLAVFFISSAFDSGTKKVENAGGTSTSTGSPGEAHTCSQSGCHGAGNGNGSTGGLADNAGPGSITISSSPAFTANHYVPGAVYHMSVTVSETGKSIFGFNAEILDNSGNTDLHINNTAGTLTITDPAHTRIAQAYGTGRATVTHTLNGGLASNSKTFVFDWTAPSTGTVNIYTSGIAGNNDNLANAIDNVYLAGKQLTPGAATGIIAEQAAATSLQLFPNPAIGQFTLAFESPYDEAIHMQIESLDGKTVKQFAEVSPEQGLFHQAYSTDGFAPGVYLVKISSAHLQQTRKLIIQ